MLISRMDQASGFVSRIFFQMPALADFFRVLDSQSTVPDNPHGKDIGRAKGDVDFDDINFSYDGKRPALVHFSLNVPAGTTVAFVGPTGAGKSTALSLLHRMWDAQSGLIRIDGMDHRDIKLESLRRNIGVVFQDSTMFYRSIADNLRIGKPDATQAELEEAAKLAEAHDFIMRQSSGYDTMVGERGTTLSGGERQRLAIARALLKNPPILILDEATSALDSVTEARIQKALKTLMAGRTTFIIAHRLSTIRDADMVVVFEHGRVVEQGNYRELIAQGGAFARLVATQQAGMRPRHQTDFASLLHTGEDRAWRNLPNFRRQAAPLSRAIFLLFDDRAPRAHRRRHRLRAGRGRHPCQDGPAAAGLCAAQSEHDRADVGAAGPHSRPEPGHRRVCAGCQRSNARWRDESLARPSLRLSDRGTDLRRASRSQSPGSDHDSQAARVGPSPPPRTCRPKSRPRQGL